VFGSRNTLFIHLAILWRYWTLDVGEDGLGGWGKVWIQSEDYVPFLEGVAGRLANFCETIAVGIDRIKRIFVEIARKNRGIIGFAVCGIRPVIAIAVGLHATVGIASIPTHIGRVGIDGGIAVVTVVVQSPEVLVRIAERIESILADICATERCAKCQPEPDCAHASSKAQDTRYCEKRNPLSRNGNTVSDLAYRVSIRLIPN